MAKLQNRSSEQEQEYRGVPGWEQGWVTEASTHCPAVSLTFSQKHTKATGKWRRDEDAFVTGGGAKSHGRGTHHWTICSKNLRSCVVHGWGPCWKGKTLPGIKRAPIAPTMCLWEYCSEQMLNRSQCGSNYICLVLCICSILTLRENTHLEKSTCIAFHRLHSIKPQN